MAHIHTSESNWEQSGIFKYMSKNSSILIKSAITECFYVKTSIDTEMKQSILG